MFCPNKFKKRYLQRIEPLKKAKPLALGSCMAAGLAAYREHEKIKSKRISDLDFDITMDADKITEETIHIESMSPVDIAQDAFMRTWIKEGQVLNIEKKDDPIRCVKRGLEILENYTVEYPDDPTDFIQPEIRFAEEIGEHEGEVITYSGRIDGVIMLDRKTQRVAIDEDKTMTRLGPVYFSELRSSYQVLWYLWMAKKLGLFSIYGPQKPICLMNAVYIHKEHNRFERELAVKTDREVDESFSDLWNWIILIRHCIKVDLFPKSGSKACMQWGGCEYLPLRNCSPSIEKQLIKKSYKITESRTI